MAKIVKELPSDPVEFLIRKLQVLQRQRKKVKVWECELSAPVLS